MSAVEARRLKLRYSKRKPVPIVTASRTESAYLITLASVGIGGIILTKVPALVTRGKFPDVTLLGMSFLGRLRISQDASTMVIQQ